MQCHWHDEMELFRVEHGRVMVQCGNESFAAEEGEIVFFNSGELHAAQSLTGEEMDYTAVVFSPEALCGGEDDVSRGKYISPVLEGSLQPRRKWSPGDPGDMTRFFDLLTVLLENKPAAYELLVRACLLALYAAPVAQGIRRAERVESSSEAAIKAAIDHIRENYRRQITIGELAGFCHMSDGHFCRMFKRYTFKTPVQYINSVRLAAAVELLNGTDRKELDIALDSGFNSLSYFIGVFKQAMGCTPAQFRK